MHNEFLIWHHLNPSNNHKFKGYLKQLLLFVIGFQEIRINYLHHSSIKFFFPKLIEFFRYFKRNLEKPSPVVYFDYVFFFFSKHKQKYDEILIGCLLHSNSFRFPVTLFTLFRLLMAYVVGQN